MKLFITAWLLLSMCFYGCKSTSKTDHSRPVAETTHTHAEHSHEGHNHEQEEHNHAHENTPHHTSETVGQASDQGNTSDKGHEDEIIFTQAQAAKTDFKVEEILPATFHRVIKTTGQVLPAPGDESVVIASHNGVISYANHSLAEGSEVKQGQPLFYITSKHLGEGDYYARTNANYEKAKAEYERAQQLITDKIISQKEYEAIRLEYRNAKIAYEAIAGKQSARGVVVPATIKGYIKNMTVKDGEYVTAGQALATVSQNKRLLLRADVSEKYYPTLGAIHSANFRTPYDNRVYSLTELSGQLLSVGKTAGANTFFVPVTFEFDNRGNIIPGSFVEIFLISNPIENVLSIPVTALTNEMGNFYVYVQLDAEGYQKREIKIGANNGQEVEVTAGLHPGERVVTRGAYQVKMASATAAIPGHTHEH